MNWLIWVIAALLFLACAWLVTGYFMFRHACHRLLPNSMDGGDMPGENGRRFFELAAEGDRYIEEHFPEEVWLRKDNLWMHAFWVDNGSDRTAVVVHGYGGHALDRCYLIPFYKERGFNVLLPDLRAHGSSEGRWIGFGVPDGPDVCEWVRWLRTNASRPQRVMLDGVSMGAATVLTASGADDLPELRLVLADCGFASPWDEFSSILKRIPLPIREALLCSANIWSHILTGFDFRHPSALDMVARSHVPTLFIHGQADDFVPPEMSDRLYAACAAPKEIMRVPNAGHALSFAADEKEYTDTVDRMIEKYIPPVETEV